MTGLEHAAASGTLVGIVAAWKAAFVYPEALNDWVIETDYHHGQAWPTIDLIKRDGEHLRLTCECLDVGE